MLLYDCKPAPNPWRVRIFLAEKGIEVEKTEVDVPGGETRRPEFLAINSLGETPVLKLDDGRHLTESLAICRYFEELHPNPPLMGRDAAEAGFVEMWTRRAEFQIMEPVAQVALHTFDFFADKLEQVPAYAETQKRLFAQRTAWLNEELSDGRSFLTGETFTVADITGMAALRIADYAGIAIDDSLSHTKAWEMRLRARESWNA